MRRWAVVAAFILGAVMGVAKPLDIYGTPGQSLAVSWCACWWKNWVFGHRATNRMCWYLGPVRVSTPREIIRPAR